MAYVPLKTFAQQQRERYTPYSASRLLVLLALSKTETHSTQTDLYVFNFSLPTGIHQFVPSLLHFSTHWAEKKSSCSFVKPKHCHSCTTADKSQHLLVGWGCL
jgi:hypothetical protein